MRQSPAKPQRVAVLKDVARLAGVDPSTVSRVLRGDERKPAKAGDPRAHPAGRARHGLPRQQRGAEPAHPQREAIGLVIPDAANPGFAEIFKGVQAVTAEAGWHVIVVEGRPNDAARPRLGPPRARGPRRRRARARREHPRPVVKRVAESGFPIVLVNRRSNGVAGSVVMNDARGSEVAVEHFFGLGHRKIGHIAGPANLDTGRRRLAGFRDALKKRKLALREEWIAETDYTEAGGAARGARAPRRSRGGDMPTAVYIASFMSGVGAIQVFKEAGLERAGAIFRSSSATSCRSPPTPRRRSPRSTCR